MGTTAALAEPWSQKCPPRHRTSLAHDSVCNNRTPSTVPTMYIVQAARLIGTLVELNIVNSPSTAIEVIE
jgi:hypothetical protein